MIPNTLMITVYFFYGLSFFVLGLSALMEVRSRKSTGMHLEGIHFLGGFGLLHSAVEWLMMFGIINNGMHLSRGYSFGLLVINSISFVLLWLYGLEQLSVKKRMYYTLPFVLGVLLILLATLDILHGAYAYELHNSLLRYLMAFPSSVVVFWGLSKHAKAREGLEDRIHSVITYGMACSFMIYGIFAGLLDTPTSFFPGNYLNKEWFKDLTGLPVEVIRAFMALLITLLFLRLMKGYAQEYGSKIKHLSMLKTIEVERRNMARNLHDRVLQELFISGLQVDELYEYCTNEGREKILISNVKRQLSDTMKSIRDFIAFVSEEHSDFTDFTKRLEIFVKTLEMPNTPTIYLENHVDLQVYGFFDDTTLSHLYYIVQEAILNAIKHGDAKTIRVIFGSTIHYLFIEIVDNGKGFDAVLTPHKGYGLKAMKERAELIHAELSIGSSRKGTTVKIKSLWEDFEDDN